MRNGRPNTVMVADDDLFMRNLIKTGIGGMAEVKEVSSGEDVLEAYRRIMPDLLFLDIHMPNIHGLDLLRQILQQDRSAYVIMISSDSTQDNVRTAVHYGARGFLTKPFRKERLLYFLNNCPTIRWCDAG